MRPLSLLVMVISTFTAYSQRTIDLKLVIFNVSNNYVLKQNEQFEVDLGIINQGPDTIFDFDECALAMKFGGDHYFPKFLDFNKTVYPGDTFFVTRGYTLEYEHDYDSIRLCFESTAYSSSSSRILSERNISFSDNQDCVFVDYKAISSTTSILLTTPYSLPYPNPCYKSELYVPFAGDIPEISLFSSNGTIFNVTVTSLKDGTMVLNVEETPPGLYYLGWTNNLTTQKFKVVIE